MPLPWRRASCKALNITNGKAMRPDR